MHTARTARPEAARFLAVVARVISGQRAAIAILLALPAGFLYSGTATLRSYRAMLEAPPASGRLATIDEALGPASMSGADLQHDVALAGWGADEDIVVTGDSSISPQKLMRVYYCASYVLYPRRVWVSPVKSGGPRLPTVPHGVRHALVVEAETIRLVDWQ